MRKLKQLLQTNSNSLVIKAWSMKQRSSLSHSPQTCKDLKSDILTWHNDGLHTTSSQLQVWNKCRKSHRAAWWRWRTKALTQFDPLVPTPGLGQACTRQEQWNLHGGTAVIQTCETHQSHQNGWRIQSIQSYDQFFCCWNLMNWGSANHHGSIWESWCLMKKVSSSEYTLKYTLPPEERATLIDTSRCEGIFENV